MLNKKQLLEEFEKLSNRLRKYGLRCTNCTNCTNCTDCEDCSDCIGCLRCTNCKDCKDCKDCEDCTDCRYCLDCNYCFDCTNCFMCFGLKGKKHGFYFLNEKVSEEEYKAAIAEFKGGQDAK